MTLANLPLQVASLRKVLPRRHVRVPALSNSSSALRLDVEVDLHIKIFGRAYLSRLRHTPAYNNSAYRSLPHCSHFWCVTCVYGTVEFLDGDKNGLVRKDTCIHPLEFPGPPPTSPLAHVTKNAVFKVVVSVNDTIRVGHSDLRGLSPINDILTQTPHKDMRTSSTLSRFSTDHE